MTPEAYIAQLRTYVGAPFHHCGRSRHGVDCVGLIICAARDLGQDPWDAGRYCQDANVALLRYGLLHSHRELNNHEDAQPGDALLLSVDGLDMHLAVLTEPGKIIHAWSSPRIGRVVEHLFIRSWQQRHRATFRWREW